MELAIFNYLRILIESNTKFRFKDEVTKLGSTDNIDFKKGEKSSKWKHRRDPKLTVDIDEGKLTLDHYDGWENHRESVRLNDPDCFERFLTNLKRHE